MDLLDRLGVGSSRIIQDRGRWGSEVARVYQRSLLRDQLDASGAMADADAADMEACIHSGMGAALQLPLRHGKG